MTKILIVEDDRELQEGLVFALEGEGYSTRAVSGKEEAVRAAALDNYSLMILDCNLPDGTGYEVCREVRKFSGMSILMLTARDTELDEVKALQMGADDYMSKPFSLAVLKARMGNLLRRGKVQDILCSNGITLDRISCRAYRQDKEIPCSSVEFRLLQYFMENRGQVLSKEQILERLWDNQGKFVDDNTVSVNIRRLRMKIEEDPSSPRLIRTVHGRGYIWRED